MGEFKDFLANYDDDFAKAEAVEFSPLPDGTYQAKVQRAYLEPNKKTGKLSFRIEFEVCAGQYQGRKAFYFKAINQKSIPYLKIDLQRLNIEPKRLSDMEDYFPSLLDKVVEIYLKTGKPDATGKTYQNTYINKMLEKAPTESINTEDLPF